ncbi:MAG TPA: ThiF family adenylyltransferase [Pyrinomonadaceae bacterium]|nr:ThiF family adenylyltransferase [Pyrinomonadaceae bacterium]
MKKRKQVVVVGAGGNIGSHLLPLLARMPEIGTLTLIDPERYNSSNLASQNITLRDVGQRKVVVQARKLRQINAGLEIRILHLRVADVPLGLLRSDLLLACLDSRRARLEVNRAVTRLGMSWIDAGVEPGGWLSRTNVYPGGSASPCLECSWDSDDYRLLEPRYSCAETTDRAFPTDAPSSLGSLAASMQALEARKLLQQGAPPASACQVLFDAKHQRHYVTTLTTLSTCRNRPHGPWNILVSELTAKQSTLLDAFRLREGGEGKERSTSILVQPLRFSRRLYCAGCGFSRTGLRLLRPNSSSDLRCTFCSRALWSSGRDQTPVLTRSFLSQSQCKRSLYSYGLRDGDVLTLRDQEIERHYEIGNGP